MDRCAVSAGATALEATGASAFVATDAGRLAMNKYHAPAAITMSNPAIPAASGASDERFFGSGGLASVAGFAWAGTPTCSE